MEHRIGLIVLGRKRPGFDQEFGALMMQKVRTFLSGTDYLVHEPRDRVVDDATLREAVADCRNHEADVLLLLQPTMADGRLVPTLSQCWDKPVVLWATPENQEGEMISSCSLVGAHNWASILSRLRHPFELVYGEPGSADTTAELETALRVCRAAARLRTASVGILGGHAPGYFAMSAGQFGVARSLGAQIQLYGLQELFDAVDAVESDRVAEDLRTLESLGIPHKDVEEDALPTASRLYLAMKDYFTVIGLDALAVRCWPEIPNVTGQWPYLGLTRLASEGYAVSVEGDFDGALCALIGRYLEMGPCHSSDWLEHDRESVTLWHGGTLPFSMSPPAGSPGGPLIARHFNIRKPAVVESTMRADMDITVMRIWEFEGAYRIFAAAGRTLVPKRHLMGTNGLASIETDDVRELFRELVFSGMPHHVSMFEGNHVETLRRLARMMDFRWIE
jgi:hypothetical protein